MGSESAEEAPAPSAQHSLPSLTLTQTARGTLPYEWDAYAYAHPEEGGDLGGMFLDLKCVGADVILHLSWEQFKSLQKAVNETAAEEEELRA